jgi:hypothetical protein
MPVISKDLIKERLMEHVGRDPNLGSAAFAVQFSVPEWSIPVGDVSPSSWI